MPLGSFALMDRITIKIKAKPLHSLEYGFGGFGRRAGLIRVFDAQKELSTASSGIEPVKKRSACCSNMHITRRRGRNARHNLAHFKLTFR